jgi:hypothetical protein
MYEWGEDEYLDRCVVNPMSRKFTLYSDQGTEIQVACETAEQFMSVLKFTRKTLTEERLKYVNL